jgi:predicted phosphodiesterase
VEIEWKKIFLTHYPMLAKPMAKSGEFDAVFCGHNHTFHQEMVNDCLLLNPWEISAHKSGKATFAIYDTTTNAAEILELQGAISVTTPEVEVLKDKSKITFNKSKSHQY